MIFFSRYRQNNLISKFSVDFKFKLFFFFSYVGLYVLHYYRLHNKTTLRWLNFTKQINMHGNKITQFLYVDLSKGFFCYKHSNFWRKMRRWGRESQMRSYEAVNHKMNLQCVKSFVKTIPHLFYLLQCTMGYFHQLQCVRTDLQNVFIKFYWLQWHRLKLADTIKANLCA